MQQYFTFPAIDPALFRLNLFGMEFALRWYALAYICGLLLGWQMLKAMMRRDAIWKPARAPMEPNASDDLLTAMILAVILGGRMGYVLFYQPAYFAANPLDILRIWDGGMSFHGGFAGVILGVLWFCWRRGLPVLAVGDAVAAVAPIGIFFGRLANFVNGELWGRATTKPWGVLFPDPRSQQCPDWFIGVCARHPSQLYEAALEGAVLFAVMVWGIRRGWLAHPGRLIGVFLLGYGAARMFVELFRQPDAQFAGPDNPIGFAFRLGEVGLTMGQILSLPMVLAGAVILYRVRRA